jgi:hypothetical protein
MDMNGYEWICMDIQDGYLIQYNKSDMFLWRPTYIQYIHRYPGISNISIHIRMVQVPRCGYGHNVPRDGLHEDGMAWEAAKRSEPDNALFHDKTGRKGPPAVSPARPWT